MARESPAFGLCGEELAPIEPSPGLLPRDRNLALELSDTHPEVRADVERNFDLWTAKIESWLGAASDRLPASTNRRALARFVLTVMEGGVMQARAANDLTPFDDSVSELRSYIDALLESALQKEKS